MKDLIDSILIGGMATSDYDGNAAAQKSVTFKIDTVPPTLSITSPARKKIEGY